jgi:AcrR family transcriptional regulator
MPTSIQSRTPRGARTPRGRETRAAILLAARRMCSERWLDQLSLAELAREAGTTRASVLFQFPEGWPDIAAELLLEELAAAAAEMAELEKGQLKPEARLRAALHYVPRRADELGALLPNLRAFNFFWGEMVDAAVAPAANANMDRIARLLRDTAPGRQPIAESRDAAEALYAFALDLVCAPIYRHLGTDQRTAKLDSAIDLMLRGLTRQ